MLLKKYQEGHLLTCSLCHIAHQCAMKPQRILDMRECLTVTQPCLLDVCRVIELLDRLQRSGELPPPKLQALQRVLQSKFCAAIREVWIHICVSGDICLQK